MSAGGFTKCSSKIRHIVRLRQMLKRWRTKASMAAAAPADVPAGHVAIRVGSGCRRFVVRAAYLNHPVFKKLLVEAEEEYGFRNAGPLVIPCDEFLFEEILRFLSGSGVRDFDDDDCVQRHCHVANSIDFWPESRPLLNESIW